MHLIEVGRKLFRQTGSGRERQKENNKQEKVVRMFNRQKNRQTHTHRHTNIQSCFICLKANMVWQCFTCYTPR